MILLLEVFFNGVYSEYTWLKKEYTEKYSNQKKYSELSPKQIRGIIDKYYNDLHDNNTRKLLFKSVEKDRKSTRLNSSHSQQSRMPSSA